MHGVLVYLQQRQLRADAVKEQVLVREKLTAPECEVLKRAVRNRQKL